jgi:Sulfotransferase family
LDLINELGFLKEDKISFSAFLERIKSISDCNRDIHLMSQFELLRPDNVEYHFIGRFEQFEHDFSKVILRINVFPVNITINTHATSAGALIADYYGQTEIDLVRKIYENDFIAFNYSTNII